MDAPGKPESTAAEPAWQRLELAWPLSLAAGFAGGWAGLMFAWPGAAPAVALLAFLPLHWPLSERADRGPAVLLTLGWLCGLAGAHLGAAFDGAPFDLGGTLGARGLLHWLEGRTAGGPGGAGLALAPSAAAILGTGLAWPTRGLGGLATAAVGTCALAAVVGARIAEQPELSPGAAWRTCPPDLVLDLVALAVASAALGRGRALDPARDAQPHFDRGRALALAIACALAASGWRLARLGGA